VHESYYILQTQPLSGHPASLTLLCNILLPLNHRLLQDIPYNIVNGNLVYKGQTVRGCRWGYSRGPAAADHSPYGMRNEQGFDVGGRCRRSTGCEMLLPFFN